MDAVSSGNEQENIHNGIQVKGELRQSKNTSKLRKKKRVQSGVVRKNVTLDSKFNKLWAMESERRLAVQPHRVLKPSQLQVSDFHNTSRDSGVETP